MLARISGGVIVKRDTDPSPVEDKKTVSVELLWREILTVADHNPAEFACPGEAWECLQNAIQFGEPFELIDGDNLQFAEKALEKVRLCARQPQWCEIWIPHTHQVM